MEIYIEVVFAFNYIIDLLLLYTLRRLFICDGKLYRLFVASAFSSTVAIILPLCSVGLVLNIVIKLLLSVVVVKLAFKGRLLRNLLGFYALTFFAGGVVISFNMFVNTNAIKTRLAILVVVLLCFIAAVKIAQKIKSLKYFNSYYMSVTLCLEDKVYKIKGFLDSGNMLQDSFGSPICVIGYDLVKSQLPMPKLLKLMSQPYYSVGIKSENLYLFKAKYIIIRTEKWQKTCNGVTIGIAFNDAFNNDFDILLHPFLINDI